MKKGLDHVKPFAFIAVSALGGLLVSLTGLPIGWMIGTLLTATVLSIFFPHLINLPQSYNGLPKYWLYIGQLILGIELGQRVNSTVISVFHDNWLTVIIMLLLSVVISLITGLFLWKYSKLDMLTSFFATTPGGLSSIPVIAEEFGANTGVVSIVQTLRAFMVILIIPIVITVWFGHTIPASLVTVETIFQPQQIAVTLLFAGIAVIGCYAGKLLKLPAPWLIGSMISIALMKTLGTVLIGYEFISWWPASLLIISQILIGASIGSRFTKEMFAGLTRTLFVSFVSIWGLIIAMFACAFAVSRFTDITFLTSGLAFAPGGIAEMSTTALVLNGDATFVVAVQVLRVIMVSISLPPLFRFLRYVEQRKTSIFLRSKQAH
ncbi:AbrB family transcriptional regulator [Sporosarcina sp.]|uniref:AbrB family transcriptional regulator n=1 Tax=Sporosarcina sp. TaxID=49982 RepID=UPI00261958A0|nr:AbrB family transcriptional regulator [Sporosarcina sp.]